MFETVRGRDLRWGNWRFPRKPPVAAKLRERESLEAMSLRATGGGSLHADDHANEMPGAPDGEPSTGKERRGGGALSIAKEG
jgi:hypothetical protein